LTTASTTWGAKPSLSFTCGDYYRFHLAAWVTDLLDRLGLANLSAIKERLSAALVKGSSFFAAQALDIGWGTANFIIGLSVMLYLLFFFVRDGDAISDCITRNSAARRPAARPYQ
jgi:predicted PurR-regulated permease PerM